MTVATPISRKLLQVDFIYNMIGHQVLIILLNHHCQFVGLIPLFPDMLAAVSVAIWAGYYLFDMREISHS